MEIVKKELKTIIEVYVNPQDIKEAWEKSKLDYARLDEDAYYLVYGEAFKSMLEFPSENKDYDEYLNNYLDDLLVCPCIDKEGNDTWDYIIKLLGFDGVVCEGIFNETKEIKSMQVYLMGNRM